MNKEISEFDPEKLAQDFARNGFAVLRNFYQVDEVIEPIWSSIRQIVEFIGKKYDVAVDVDTPFSAMTNGYTSLIAANRAFGSEVYDAIKQIPSFMRLVSHPRNAQVFEVLRLGSVAGIAAGGYGIRIDNPGEEKFRAHWHQEFPAQLRSIDGIVYWSPLLSVSQEAGPVQILPGSHREGYLSVYEKGEDGRTGAYALLLDRESEIIKKYEVIAPLTEPGDLVLMDFLTVHQSGYNISTKPRWSMQFRYFNYADPIGQNIKWQGSFAMGNDHKSILRSIASKI